MKIVTNKDVKNHPLIQEILKNSNFNRSIINKIISEEIILEVEKSQDIMQAINKSFQSAFAGGGPAEMLIIQWLLGFTLSISNKNFSSFEPLKELYQALGANQQANENLVTVATEWIKKPNVVKIINKEISAELGALIKKDRNQAQKVTKNLAERGLISGEFAKKIYDKIGTGGEENGTGGEENGTGGEENEKLKKIRNMPRWKDTYAFIEKLSNAEEYIKIFGCIVHSKKRNTINRAKCSSNYDEVND